MSLIKEKYWDLCAGIFLFLFSIALYYGGMTVKTLEVSSFGSGFFPKVVAVLLALTTIPIIQVGVKKAKAPEKAAEQAGAPRWKAVLATFAIMLGYAAFMPALGFMITTVLYLFIQMNILVESSRRNLVLFAVVSVVSAVVIYYTFVLVFKLMLPAGFIG